MDLPKFFDESKLHNVPCVPVFVGLTSVIAVGTPKPFDLPSGFSHAAPTEADDDEITFRLETTLAPIAGQVTLLFASRYRLGLTQAWAGG